MHRWCTKQSSGWWDTTNGSFAKSRKAWRKSIVVKCSNIKKSLHAWKPDYRKTATGVMQVRWTSAATDDLENIANYLFEKTPKTLRA